MPPPFIVFILLLLIFFFLAGVFLPFFTFAIFFIFKILCLLFKGFSVSEFPSSPVPVLLVDPVEYYFAAECYPSLSVAMAEHISPAWYLFLPGLAVARLILVGWYQPSPVWALLVEPAEYYFAAEC